MPLLPKKKTQFNKIFTVAVEVKNDSVKERRSIVLAAVDEISKKKNFAEYCSWASVNCHWAPCVSDNICLVINYDLNCQRSFNYFVAKIMPSFCTCQELENGPLFEQKKNSHVYGY